MIHNLVFILISHSPSPSLFSSFPSPIFRIQIVWYKFILMIFYIISNLFYLILIFYYQTYLSHLLIAQLWIVTFKSQKCLHAHCELCKGIWSRSEGGEMGKLNARRGWQLHRSCSWQLWHTWCQCASWLGSPHKPHPKYAYLDGIPRIVYSSCMAPGITATHISPWQQCITYFMWRYIVMNTWLRTDLIRLQTQWGCSTLVTMAT